MISVNSFCTAPCKASGLLAVACSSLVGAGSRSDLAGMIVFIATSGPAIDWFDPTARNSKRLPVKANGLVRLRSPASLGSGGSTSTPTVSVPFEIDEFAPPALICWKTSVSWSPRKIEMIAGGASLAPRR